MLDWIAAHAVLLLSVEIVGLFAAVALCKAAQRGDRRMADPVRPASQRGGK